MPKLLTTGDLLKHEDSYKSREEIPAPVGTTIGQLVKHPTRKQYLVALSDERFGKVAVQPRDCTIFLDNVAQADIEAVFTDEEGTVPLTVDELIAQGDAHGIRYIGTPYTA